VPIATFHVLKEKDESEEETINDSMIGLGLWASVLCAVAVVSIGARDGQHNE
jgi:hypothetical protein